MITTKTVALAILAWSLLAAGQAVAQTCSNTIAAEAPNERYRDNGDGTVLDLTTGLEWKQCPEGLSGAGCAVGSLQAFTWQQALARAEAVNGGGFAGKSDWRLSDKNELASLVERRCYSPAINLNLFPRTPSSGFWSSSPSAYNASNAWFVDFDYGFVSYYPKDYGGYVRLVRGGQ